MHWHPLHIVIGSDFLSNKICCFHNFCNIYHEEISHCRVQLTSTVTIELTYKIYIIQIFLFVRHKNYVKYKAQILPRGDNMKVVVDIAMHDRYTFLKVVVEVQTSLHDLTIVQNTIENQRQPK